MSNAQRITTLDRELKQERDYWVNRLTGGTEASNINLDYERPASYSGQKHRLDLELPEEVIERLAKLTSNSTLLVYTVLMAALKICLYKYTAAGTVTVGSPARRKEDEPDPLNALAIVDAIDSHLSFREFLLKVRETLIEAYSRQRYPFNRLVREIGLDQIDNRCPLFDIVMAVEDLHGDLPALKNDITMTFRVSPDKITGVVEYDTQLFRHESINLFAARFLRVLRAALNNIDSRIYEIDILTEAERHQMLVEWNDTTAHFSKDLCAHKLFEAQAASSPDSVALVFEDNQVTYGELNRRANRLAHYLKDLGVAPETLVGICMERSPDMIVSLLGVLKAGGAYVPIDPAYPKERIGFVLKDARIETLLTRQESVESLPEYEGKLVCLDADWETIAKQSDEDPAASATADNVAYVIYTSGSTGQPKGVLVEHRGLCNLVEAQVRAFGVEPESRVIQFASFSFDASVSEIFTALATGAALCLGERNAFFSGATFVQWLRDQAITTATLPPAILSVLPSEDLPNLKTVVAAGESCPGDIVSRWSADRRLINAYGPTEATVCASLTECAGTYAAGPPIGKPIANTRIYIVDADLQPVPAGVEGELLIGGVGLARGYLNRQGLTAEKFIPDPFSRKPGARLYKTGDMARYLPDGNIEFAGRLDHQVKIRGYRIEMGEIEAALARNPEVAESLAMVREDVPGEKRLVAYVVARDGQAVNVSRLRGLLKESLPEYMVPSAVAVIDALPLTLNGKVDRRALPVPERTRADLKESYVPPRTVIEKKLVEVWTELLGVEKVGVQENFLIGIHDHFFDLGGHSLLAVRMFARIRDAFQVELPLNLLFTTAPTVAGLAKAIEQYMIEMADAEEIIAMLRELDEMSDEEIQTLLENEGRLVQGEGAD